MVDILLIVSSNPEQCSAYTLVHDCDIARSVYHFSKGTDCLGYVESLPKETTILAIVDSNLDDLGSRNVVNALHLAHDRMRVVAVLDDGDADEYKESVNKAMLAGARCVIRKDCSLDDLKSTITKVNRSERFESTEAEEITDPGKGTGVRVAVISARGGSGKSYVSTLLAATLARNAKRTLLLDADIQFSDLSLMFDAIEPISAHDMQGIGAMKPEVFAALGSDIKESLKLLRFETSPELAETFAAGLHPMLGLCTHSYDATVVNTASFWTLFQSALLEECDCIVVVSDHRLPGIKATQKLNELLDRLQIPTAKRLYIINEYRKPGLSLYDIEQALGCEQAFMLPCASREFCAVVDAGNPFRALDESDEFAYEFLKIAEAVALITGLPLHDTQAMQKRVDQGGWMRRIFG